MTKIRVTSEIDIEDLVYQVTDFCEYDQIKELIIQLDRCSADWEFTESLANYFITELIREGHMSVEEVQREILKVSA